MDNILDNFSRINILDTETSNQIAAGEVVERPVSVVKELVENSIDAGAMRISVSVFRNRQEDCIGRIEISDDGIGMSKKDLETAFFRHATSKISKIEDLDTVLSLGFRGEALPSIASVSHVSVQSRSIEALSGYEGKVIEGKMVINGELGMPVGTKITVEDLFYNTPARKKFLKSAAVEQSHIAKLIANMILSSPEIAFVLKVDGRTVLHSAGSGSVKQAVMSVYGAENVSNLAVVDYNNDNLKIEGLVSKPPFSRSNRNYYHFFVNGRLVKSRELSYILDLAYDTLLPEKRYPMAILYIHVSPKTVDVNVHPAKTEIRFRNRNDIKDAVLSAVKVALMPTVKPSIHNSSVSVDKTSQTNAEKAKLNVINSLQNLEIKSESGKTFKFADLFTFDNKQEEELEKRKSVDIKKDDNVDFQTKEKLNEDWKNLFDDNLSITVKAAEPSADPTSAELDMSASKQSDFSSKLFEMLVGINAESTDKTEAKKTTEAEDKSEKNVSHSNEIPNPYQIYNEYLGYYDEDDNSENDNKKQENSPLSALNGLFNIGSMLSADKNKTKPQTEKTVAVQNTLFDDDVNLFEAIRPMGQLNSSYIIGSYGEDLYIIDQHAAHERILYEEFCKEYNKNKNQTAMLAVPSTMELGDLAKELLLNNLEAVTDFGFIVEYLGDSTFVLRGVPYWFSIGKNNENVRRSDNFRQSAEEFFLDITEKIVSNAQGEDNKLSFSDLNKEELFTMACKNAVKANSYLTQSDINWLLRQLAKAEKPLTCPHGRPTVIKISDDEIRKRFMRS